MRDATDFALEMRDAIDFALEHVNTIDLALEPIEPRVHLVPQTSERELGVLTLLDEILCDLVKAPVDRR